jgi:predicted acyltransferase
MEASRERLGSIDAFRGLAIVLMVAANYLAGVSSVPAGLRHAPDIGLTVIDLIAPMFVCAMGLTYVPSALSRREREGARQAVFHHLRRYLAIAGVGALLAAGEMIFMPGGARYPWGVLQALGFSGVLILPLVFSPTWARLVAGVGLLAVYQIALDHSWLSLVLASSHGGLPGTLSWAGMLALATVLGDLYRRSERRWLAKLLAPVVLLGAGLLLALVAPMSKNRVSSSYVLVSLGTCAAAYLGFQALCDTSGVRIRHLEAWGANPLLLYLLHELALGLVVLPGVASWYAEAPVWLVVLQLAVLLALLGGIAELLRRRRFVLAL